MGNCCSHPRKPTVPKPSVSTEDESVAEKVRRVEESRWRKNEKDIQGKLPSQGKLAVRRPKRTSKTLDQRTYPVPNKKNSSFVGAKIKSMDAKGVGRKKRGIKTAPTSKFKVKAAPKCIVCNKSVYTAEEVKWDGISYHKACFRCLQCNRTLQPSNVAKMSGQVYCKGCFTKTFRARGKYDDITTDVPGKKKTTKSTEPVIKPVVKPKYEAKTAPASQIVRAEKTSVFSNDTEESAVGLSAKERMKILQRNIAKAGEVDYDKRKSRQEKNFKSAPKIDRKKWNTAKDMISGVLNQGLRQKQEIEAIEADLLGDLETEEADKTEEAGKTETSSAFKVSGDQKKQAKKRKESKKEINLNNNAAIAKLSDKKKDDVYKAMAEKARKSEKFSATGCQLGDDFIKILVKKALQPGQAPKLVEINLDSNHITNPGYKLLAESIGKIPTLRTIKLRHQIGGAPSVPIQKLFLDALEANTAITSLGVDMKTEYRRKKDALEMRHKDLIRKARLAASKA